MDKKLKKRIIILSVLLLIIIFSLILSISFSSKNNYKSIALNKVNIVNVNIDEADGIYTYSSTIIAKEDITLNRLNILFKDEDGNTIESLFGYINKSLKENEEYKVVSSTDIDLTNVKDIEYTLN